MNKLRKVGVMILLWAGVTEISAGNTWLKEEATSLETGLKDPASVRTLIIDCGSNDPDRFINSAASFSGVQQLILKGCTEKTPWDKLISAINNMEQLHYLEFNSGTFVKAPVVLNELTRIRTLAFSDLDKLDIEGLAYRLAGLENLEELKLEIYSVQQLPENLSDISSLHRISIFNKEIIFGDNRDGDDAWLKTGSDFTILWTDDLKAKRELKVSYFSIGESISGEDMYSLSALYPNADLSSFSALTDPTVRSLSGSEFKKWDKQYNYVKPPIQGVDVDKQYYSVNSMTGGDFTYSSGTRISIPPHAFVDKNGRAVNGQVVIDYREFRDQADILASGIPMTYDSGGVLNNFESAGMFEINASQNGEEIFLKGGKKIEMDFSSVDDRTSFNLYAFDDAGTGNWNLLGKAGTIRKTDPNAFKILSNAYNNYRSSMSFNSFMVYDSTPFNERFKSDLYTYVERNKAKGKWHKISANKKEKWLTLDANRGKKLSWLVKPVFVAQKNGHAVFQLKYVASKLTELNYFADVKWMTEEKVNGMEFRRKFSYKNFYNDMRITKDGDNYLLTFKGRNGYQEVLVRPVTYNTANKKADFLKDNGEKKYKRYMKMMRYKERTFARELKAGQVENNRFIPYAPEEKSKYCWEMAKKFMSSEERKMNFEDWMVYYDRVIKNEKELTANSEANTANIIRSFTLDGMGIYNCDQIRRIPSPVTLYATFKDRQEGGNINAKVAYIVMKGINSVFSYGSWSSKNGAMEISFGKNSSNVMITIDHDGSVSLFTSQEFKKEDFSGRNHTFGMNDVSGKIASVGELRELMGLK